MSAYRVGINGFGRIGRAVFRQMFEREGLEVAAINDLSSADDLAYLLRNDSVHGRLEQRIEVDDGRLVLDDERIPFTSVEDPAEIDWKEQGVDLVIEATGVFRGRDDAAKHLEAGASHVLVTAPSDDADAHVVYGVNHRSVDPERHRVISATSCTTNCLVPMVHVLHEAFGLESATFITVHAYTASQTLVDTPMRKRRRGRAAALNMIPTTTGAAKASERVLTHLRGRLQGMALRVPVPDGSITDLVARLEMDVDVDAVVGAFAQAAHGALDGVLRVEEDEIVSLDVVGDPASCVVDRPTISVHRGRTVRVLGWYDNEWGYASRVVDLTDMLSEAR
jgi:glyceraldehyde 3-phosphate dehydrogenase